MKGFKFVFVGLACMLFPIHAGAEAPDEFISEIVDLLGERLEGRKNELSKDADALYALIDDILLPRFARKRAAQQVLATHWRAASEEQRERFVSAFYSVLIQRYADGILEFEHDRIKVLPFRGDLKSKRVIVKTRVDIEGGKKISVNYGLVSRDSSWMMWDVTIEGVSYIRNFRAEFDSEINATSLEEVIVRLEDESSGNSSE
ncbi:MAG: ABC transporter substrate-binding protein [Proteobacteria bacterium]|nr:ABC transporter substrate-binding protein [Pseudomonadota bacterium]